FLYSLRQAAAADGYAGKPPLLSIRASSGRSLRENVSKRNATRGASAPPVPASWTRRPLEIALVDEAPDVDTGLALRPVAAAQLQDLLGAVGIDLAAGLEPFRIGDQDRLGLVGGSRRGLWDSRAQHVDRRPFVGWRAQPGEPLPVATDEGDNRIGIAPCPVAPRGAHRALVAAKHAGGVGEIGEALRHRNL